MEQSDVIYEYCIKAESDNPLKIAMEIMDDPLIRIHGPEHHVIVGSALAAAFKNAGGSIVLPEALSEIRKRGQAYPGASCGNWGCCGAAVSAGTFYSIVNNNTVFSEQTWGEANILTGLCLQAIGIIGGPRCCKRDSFTAIKIAVPYINERMNVTMSLPEKIICHYSSKNVNCLHERCPYNK